MFQLLNSSVQVLKMDVIIVPFKVLRQHLLGLTVPYVDPPTSLVGEIQWLNNQVSSTNPPNVTPQQMMVKIGSYLFAVLGGQETQLILNKPTRSQTYLVGLPKKTIMIDMESMSTISLIHLLNQHFRYCEYHLQQIYI